MIDGTTVIDFHGHPGRWGSLDNRAETVLRAMDAVGIDRACVFDIHHSDGRTANDRTAAMVSEAPDRLSGFAYVSPLMPERMVPELERAIDQQGMLAIKLYPSFANINLNEPAWFPIYEFANDRGLAIITHTGIEPTTSPRFLAEVAPRFPKAIFVAGHSGNVAPIRREAIDAARGNENVYLETCSTFRTPGVIEQLVAEAGAERILFGSDAPLMDPRSQLGKIITADIDEDTKRMILGMNAQRILGL